MIWSGIKMNIRNYTLVVAGVHVRITHKQVKNLHLGVYPPNGHVRVAAPLQMGENAIRMAIITRLGWIKTQQQKFDAQLRQTSRQFVSGETHYYLGRGMRLNVLIGQRKPAIQLMPGNSLGMYILPACDRTYRQQIMMDWYRKELRNIASPLVAHWAQQFGIIEPTWQIRRMKTRWGTCNVDRRRILLNLELIKKPPKCIEYVIVHELAHFLESKHSENFYEFLDQTFPIWRTLRNELNAEPLADEDWHSK